MDVSSAEDTVFAMAFASMTESVPVDRVTKRADVDVSDRVNVTVCETPHPVPERSGMKPAAQGPIHVSGPPPVTVQKLLEHAALQ